MSQMSMDGSYNNLRFLQKARRKPLGTLAVVLGVIGFILVIHFSTSPSSRSEAKRVWQSTLKRPLGYGSASPLLRDSQNPGTVVPSPGRETDVIDTFEEYTRYPFCHVSSLELHEPFSPLCPDRQSLLKALSGGGRAGIDMPYIPRGCDMRWFSTTEMCKILSKFSYVFVIGDSMMRNLAVAFHVLMRRDLYEGGHTTWSTDPADADCHCSKSFESGKCIFNSAWSSKMVWEHDASSMWCAQGQSALVEFVPQTAYPSDTKILEDSLPTAKPDKPAIFLYGHGIWNDLNETATHLWIDQIESAIKKTCPWLTEPNAHYKRLFITPSAAGGLKPKKFEDTQGNFALKSFEFNIGPYVQELGMDHLGTINMTVQSTSHDGTHAGMKPNLIKAMMVLNWLNFII